VALEINASETDIHRHVGIFALLLQLQAFLSGGRELTLGKPVHAVIFDDIDHIDVTAHGMLELTHTDAGAVAVAGDANALHVCIAEQRARRNGRHASVQGVETEAAVHEIGRRFGRTADAGELDDIFRHDVHFVHCRNDLIRDRVMSAALAQGAGRTAVIIFAQADGVDVCSRASHGKCFAHSVLLLFTDNYFRFDLTADLDLVAAFLTVDFFTAAFFFGDDVAGAAFAFATVFFTVCFSAFCFCTATKFLRAPIEPRRADHRDRQLLSSAWHTADIQSA
jgi:hypothetical protein